MAIKVDAAPIIKGNNHTMRLTSVVDADGALIDMSGWTLVTWFLRRAPNSTDHILAVAGTRSGVFNADPDLNAQVWAAPILDTETEDLAARTSYYAWKRMDAGFEADLAYGEQPVISTASR